MFARIDELMIRAGGWLMEGLGHYADAIEVPEWPEEVNLALMVLPPATLFALAPAWLQIGIAAVLTPAIWLLVRVVLVFAGEIRPRG